MNSDPLVPAYDGPAWVPFANASDAHPAAFRAVLHTPTRCVLMLLWFPAFPAGEWAWHVRHPSGRWTEAAAGHDPADLHDRADAAIRGLLRQIEETQLGG